MCCSAQSYTSVKLAKLLWAYWLLSIGALFFCDPCLADVPVLPKPIDWVAGPAQATLGTIADIKVPAGYRFADASGAATFLEQAKSPVPKNLIGLLAPEAGGSWVVFEFADIGYVKEDDKDRLNDADAILALVSARMERQKENGMGPVPTATAPLGWELKPMYDASQHMLEWAIFGSAGPAESSAIHSFRLLGRHGVLSVTSVGPHRDASDVNPLKDLLGGVTFKPDQGYADYRKGEKRAAAGLTELITSDVALTPDLDPSAIVQSADTGGGSTFWIALVLLAGAVGVGGVLMARKLKRFQASSRKPQFFHEHDKFIEDDPNAAPLGVAKSAQAIGSRSPRNPSPRPVNGFKPSTASKSRLAPPGLSNKKSPSKKPLNNRNGDRRRKVFNYHKFYTDMVLQGPAPAMGVENYSGHAFDQNRPEPMIPDQGIALNANSELISNQKNLIEEQKRLIEEQGRFIQEKSKLIAEKNQLLQRQTELFDNNLL
jgi:uncharacterized membrane-anchored protein